jgi:hypothetical protein
MTVESDNERALRQAVANLQEVVRSGVESTSLSLPQVGLELTSKVKETLSQPGRGVLYRGRRGRGDHRASAPGDPPAVDTGQYRASFAWATGGSQGQRWVDVGTAQERGPFLEYGTSRMEARPHLRPAVAEYSGSLRGRIAAAHEAAQRRRISSLRRPA